MNNKNLVITLAVILTIASVSVSAIQRGKRSAVKMCRDDNNDLVPCSSIQSPIMGNDETTNTNDDVTTTQTDTSKTFGEYYTPSETWKE